MKTLNKNTLAKDLATDNEGLALTEFAFLLPILLTLVFGGLEIANYGLAHLRVSQIAMTVADNAGRVQTSIDEVDIYEVFEGAETVGDPIDFDANGRLVLSSLEDNGHDDGRAGQMINWQRCMGDLTISPAYGVEGDGRNNDSLEDGLGPSGKQIQAGEETAVMFVEATYDYQPLVDIGFIKGTEIRYESAFNVRERANQTITNTQSLAERSCD
ncbi:pilus assembly protein [Erythrobacter sp.]|nr:pilus assembly protein [Erythrobacter sp.]